MGTLRNFLKPNILLYGSQTYLGKKLQKHFETLKIKVVGFESVVSKEGFRVLIFIKQNDEDSVDQVNILKSLVRLAKKPGTKLLLITSLKNDPLDLFLEKIITEQKSTDNCSIIKLPIVYGPEVPVRNLGILGEYFKSLLGDGVLKVPGEGLQKTPYIYFSDAVEVVLSSALSQSLPPKQETIIYPAETLTDLETAYLLKALSEKVVRVDCQGSDDEQPKNFYALSNFTPQVPLREGLRETIKCLQEAASEKAPVTKTIARSLKVETKLVKEKETIPLVTSIKPTSAAKAPLRILVTAAIILATGITLWWPLAKTAYFGYLGKKSLEKSVSELGNLKVLGAETSAGKAEEELSLALANSERLLKIPLLNRSRQFLQGGTYLASALNNLSELIVTFSKDNPSIEEIKALSPLIKEASNNITLARLELTKANYGGIEQIGGLEKALLLLGKIYPAVPSFLGYDGPKEYLVLFQNPMELRPTGGFIGSYAKVILDQGNISSILFDDIYNPDGQLEQKNLGAPLPADMQEAFPSFKKLYLRDANWWISFPESSRNIAALYKLATGEQIDGVLAVDLDFVRELLEVTGPIYLGSYDQTVTSSNLFEVTQYQSEGSYFEGSPQKKNFLKLLGNKLLEQIIASDNSQKLRLVAVVKESLEQKHLLISLFDNEASYTLAENGWDGHVNPPINSDFIMAVDTNVGGNKANYFVRRNLNYEVKNTYREGTLEGFLTITYHNTAKAGAWPASSYKNYLRVLVPKDSFLNEANIEQLSATDKSGDKPSIKVSTDNGFTVFSYGFELPPGESLTLKLHYTLPQELNLRPFVKNYNLEVLKQPGTAGDPFTFKFYTPFGRQLSIPQGFKAESDGTSYSSLLNTDSNLQIPIN